MFINDNPIEIALTPYLSVSNGKGGFTLQPQTPRTLQTMTMIKPNGVGATLEITTEDGKIIVPDFVLVAEVEAEIERNDRFEHDGATFVVRKVDYSRHDWAKHAAVTRWTNA